MSYLPKLLLAGAAGYLGYHFLSGKKVSQNAAFASDQPHEDHTDVRDAGPSAMRDPPERAWTDVDEDSDQSFPASDPPGGY